MVSYFISSKKNMSYIPYIDFKLYGNIVIPSWVDLDQCHLQKLDNHVITTKWEFSPNIRAHEGKIAKHRTKRSCNRFCI